MGGSERVSCIDPALPDTLVLLAAALRGSVVALRFVWWGCSLVVVWGDGVFVAALLCI